MAGAVPEPEDFKTFIREITRRHEVATDAMIRRSDATQAAMKLHFDAQAAATGAQAAVLNEQTEALREHRTVLNEQTLAMREITAALREFRGEVRNDMRELFEEMRAQRAALFVILDRLQGGGAEAGA
jgi:hypothetical protein